MVTLTESERMIVLAAGIGVVAVTVVLVACIVVPICPLHRLLPLQARIRATPTAKRRHLSRKSKSEENGKIDSEQTQLRVTSYISYGNDFNEHELVESDLSVGMLQQPPHTGHRLSSTTTTTMTPPDSLSFKPAERQRRPTVLSTRNSTVDSTYSSMTPTGSRPSSPVSFKSDAPDMLSSLDSTSVRSADNSPLYGSVTVSIQLSTTEDSALVRILIGIQEAQDLPARDGISCGDPFFRVSIVKESRAFRRSKTRSNVLAEFQTTAQKKTRHPIYNQKFAKEINRTDVKDCVIKFAAFDKDKYANPTEFGEAAVTLKNLSLSLQGQPIQFCLELSEPKQNNGELQLSVMYLPTAERLAFNLFKVSNLRLDMSKGEAENYKIFVRVILLHNGKMVTKKKTSAAQLLGGPQTFDESIAFDVPTEQMQNLSFIVAVVSIPMDSTASTADTATADSSPEGSFSSYVGVEQCIGKVVVGSKARSTGLQHWELALQRPREQVVLWHILR